MSKMEIDITELDGCTKRGVVVLPKNDLFASGIIKDMARKHVEEIGPEVCEYMVKNCDDDDNGTNRGLAHNNPEPGEDGNFKKQSTQLSHISIKHPTCHKTNYISKKFRCEICNRMYETDLGLTMHIKKFHRTIGFTFACDKCSFTSWGKHIVEIHKSTHKVSDNIIRTYDGNLCCKFCSTLVSTKNAMYKHILQKHASDVAGVLEQCHICAKIISTKSGLFHHIARVHKDLKPFHCKKCDSGFQNQNILDNHNKPYSCKNKKECDICLLKFSTRCDFELHINQQHYDCKKKMEENQFVCTICNKIIVGKSKSVHYKEVHEEQESFKCQFCSKRYKLLPWLNTHIGYVHCTR